MWNCKKIEHKHNYLSFNGYGAFLEQFCDSVSIAIPWENYTQDHRIKDTLSILHLRKQGVWYLCGSTRSARTVVVLCPLANYRDVLHCSSLNGSFSCCYLYIHLAYSARMCNTYGGNHRSWDSDQSHWLKPQTQCTI